MRRKYFAYGFLIILMVAGCGGRKQNLRASAPSNTTSTTQTVSNLPSNIVENVSAEGKKSYLVLPDKLALWPVAPVFFETSGPYGEKATFGVMGQPEYSDATMAQVSAFRAKYPNETLEFASNVGTRMRLIQQDWLGDRSQVGIIFKDRPKFGEAERVVTAVRVPFSFYIGYRVTESGAHFVQTLYQNPNNFGRYFGYRVCYEAAGATRCIQSQRIE